MYLKILIASVITGLISGFFIVFYSLSITFLTYFFFSGNPIETAKNLPIWYLYTLPTVAILIVNYIISKDENVREYGLNEITDSIIENRLVFRLKTLFLKIVASTISLSSGFSVGTEGPSATIGAMVAYHIHRWFKLPKMLIKMMISVGASSGIAAIFVSPVTGIAFAVEMIAHQFVKKYISYLILSAILAFVVSVSFLEPIFFLHTQGKTFEWRHIFAYLIFIPYITFFIYLYLFFKKRFFSFINLEIVKSISIKYKNYIFALIGGLSVGTILTLEPRAAFSGHELVLYLINSQHKIALSVIFLILFLRIISTTLAIYSNAVGGIFLPLMSIGALAGYGFGEIISNYSYLNIEPFYFAAIGSSVFMGVIMKLPLTAVILSLETTFDYNVVVATAIIVILVEYLSDLIFNIKRRDVIKKEKS